MKHPAAHVALVALAFVVVLLTATGSLAAAGVYYYIDEDGSFHFTDAPERTNYRVFAVFKNFPDADKKEILRVIKSKARNYGIDPSLVQALVQVESNFKPGAVSNKGAQGLMQLMPSTGKDMGLTSPHDVSDNIEAGVRYLKLQLDRFGDKSLALAAYNAGPNAVERYGGIPPYKETQDYVRKVLSIYNRLKGGS